MTIIQGKAVTQFDSVNIKDTFFINGAQTNLVAQGNQIIINQESDFPTQDGTTITLDAGKNFVLGAAFTTAKRFIIQEGVNLTANNFLAPILTYSGTGVMFTATDVAFTMDNIKFDAPNASRGFVCSGASNTKGVNFTSVFFDNLAEWGTFDSLQALVMDNNVILSSTGKGGVTTIGTGWFAYTNMAFAVLSSSSSFIANDLGTSVHSALDIEGQFHIAPSGGIGIKGLTNNGNMQSGALATITGNTFTGGMTDYLSGITEDDIRYIFAKNANISDTNPDLLLSLTGNSTATTVSGGTPKLLAGTWNSVERASQFTGTTAGRGTFLGERVMAGPIDISVTVEPASGNNKDISAYVAIDGTFQANSKTTVRVDAANPKVIAIPWQTDFSLGTFIEIYVSNDTDNVSVLGTSAILRIR